MIPFYQFISDRFSQGSFSTEDALACLLPLMRQVAEAHAQEMVAPLEGIESLQVEDARVFFLETSLQPIRNQRSRVRRVQRYDQGAVEVVGRESQVLSVGALGHVETSTLDVVERESPIVRPVFVPGYLGWEHLLDHHDPLTDVFSLGQILASVTLGLDFNDPKDVERFANHRTNLFAINPDVHPVIARAITRMTELVRESRVQELPLVIKALENYRQQEVEVSVEPSDIEGFESRDLQGKQQVLLDRLQKRLFEITRRNRLLHFRPTMQTINLTQASVPLSFDYKNIRDDQILVSDSALEKTISDGNSISLNKRLNFAEAIYLPSQLDRIIRETRRDMTEYGFVQLRLVLCMLHWSNLKEKPHERFSSPLVLVPVQLKKKRGVRDKYSLEPLSNDAEVNPVIRYLFKQLYDVRLPETIDLDATGLQTLYEFMAKAIASSEPAVELKKVDRPRIKVLHAKAKRHLENYRRKARISGRGIRTFRDLDYSYDPATYHPLGIKIFTQSMRPPETTLNAIMQSAPKPRHFAVPDEDDEKTNDPEPINSETTASESDPSVDAVQESTTESAEEQNPQGDSTAKANEGSSEQNEGEASSESKDDDLDDSERETEKAKPEERKSPKAKDDPAVKQDFYQMQGDDDSNPYNWSFDLCSVTLANFRYRRMSLVRDYERLVAETPHNAAFEASFSLVPRPANQDLPPTPPITDRYDVVPCDPTQATSIAQARVGDSYIVQGPPGTGKSQTITNLIADYVARGKRVLFVCEKRAAIDVVFARLRKCGLSDLCCLIHDSQADKKSFVMDLKETYETFLEEKSKRKKVSEDRNSRVTAVQTAIAPLQNFSDTMQESTYRVGVPTSELIERAIQLQSIKPELEEVEKERLPAWRAWNEGRSAIEKLIDNLKRQQPDGILARHPLRNLQSQLANDDRPTQTVTEGMSEANGLLDSLGGELKNVGHGIEGLSFVDLKAWLEHCQLLSPMLEEVSNTTSNSNAFALLDGQSERSIALRGKLDELNQKQSVVSAMQQENSSWKERIPKRDLQPAIDLANNLTTKWVPIIRPSWWRMRKVLKRSYDFSSHAIKPSWVAVLTKLRESYDAEDEVQSFKSQVASEFSLTGDIDKKLQLIQQLRVESQEYPPWKAELHSKIVNGEIASEDIRKMRQQLSTLRSLRSSCDEFLDRWELWNCHELACELETIDQAIGDLPEYLICLQELGNIPEEARVALQRMNLRPEQIESASVFRSLELLGRENREFERFDQTARSNQVDRLEGAHNRWMDINAEFVRQQTQAQFLEHVHQTSAKTPASGEEETRFRKSYSEGRRTLEHEFGKQMRYKSIRDLVSGDSGRVVRDLKPVWLMSPLSVSDTLPLGDQDFDVVIFDEASQITLEASIPSLFRAAQAIVVGDEQQLPPTDFFTSTKDREDDDEVTFDHEGEMVTYDLESNSLLNHAARNLPSTMLGWHYRSRDEALISFSNWAFYNGRLNTIPEETIVASDKPSLVANGNDEVVGNCQVMFDRPVSFHQMKHGVYLRRRNRPEAEYIAGMIREILLQQDGRTIGVIAFSEAQQDEIENAIDRLAKEDSDFSALLEAEFVREDDGQFVGLLVKNLENIQGDERDVIILSVCYGPDDNGRMIMNFGPINKSGGEKRLNVAFSRAKHHMAIVSTIQYSAITNEYNVGANCLRNYLRYAESISSGDASTAASILHGLSPWRETAQAKRVVPEPLKEIAKRLVEHDLQVDFNIGHSDFRCDMGVRKEGDNRYRLGILVDAGNYYDSKVELIDRELFRPRLLGIFGWEMYSILLKDWLENSDDIVKEIVTLCETKQTDPQSVEPETVKVDQSDSRDVEAELDDQELDNTESVDPDRDSDES